VLNSTEDAHLKNVSTFVAMSIFETEAVGGAELPERESPVALAEFEITQAEALRQFALFGALVIVAAAGLWLIDEFVWPIWRH
jgi:hypothetical protein